MKLSQIYYAVEVAKCQSFSNAAKNLFITQPTLSQQIRQLEKELGTPLFFRNTKEVKMTRAGMEFLEYAIPMLDNMDRLQTAMQKYSSPVKGHLKIGLVWSFTYLHIDSALCDFTQAYPDIEVELIIDGSISLTERFQSHDLNIMFINSHEQKFKAAWEYHLISEDSLCAIVNNKHPLSLKSEIRASDLCGENLLLPAENTAIGQDILAMLGDYLSDIHVLGKSSQVDICLQTAASDLGISFASRIAVKEQNHKNLPVLAIPLCPSVVRRTYMVYDKKQRKNPLVDTFVKFMANYYRKNCL